MLLSLSNELKNKDLILYLFNEALPSLIKTTSAEKNHCFGDKSQNQIIHSSAGLQIF